MNEQSARLGLVAMPGAQELGNRVNEYLLRWRESPEGGDTVFSSVPGPTGSFLVRNSCPRFSNGEAKGMLHESVRGDDLYFLCDVGNYGVTYKMYGVDVPMSPDDHFQDLKRLIAAAGGKSKRLNVIMPMLYEGRQDRRQSRESLDCAMALRELASMGVENIITFDAHNVSVQNSIPLCGFESVKPTYQILKALFLTTPDLRIDAENLMIISPDAGATSRNVYYATMMGLPMGMFYKRRDYATIVNGRNPIIAHEYVGESLSGKDVFIADDILATGDSILDVSRELKERGARRIFIAVTFGLFTEGLERFDRACEEGLIHRVLATNLTYTNPELIDRPWFTLVDMSKYIAYIIATLNHDQTISKLLIPAARIKALLSKHREALNLPEQTQLEV